MRVPLLVDDLRELAELGLEPGEAARRGRSALGAPPAGERPQERPGSDEGVQELTQLYAEAVAEVRRLRFEVATRSPEYERSRRRRDRVDDSLADVRAKVVPALRARLRELRAEEEQLERELAAQGIDPQTVSPRLPEATSVDPSPRPGEGGYRRRPIPLEPPGRVERLVRRLRRA